MIWQNDEQDFKVIVENMIEYLSFVEKETPPVESLAIKVFSMVCRDKAFKKSILSIIPT